MHYATVSVSPTIVTNGGSSVGQCGRLNQPSWVLGDCNIIILSHLVIVSILMLSV